MKAKREHPKSSEQSLHINGTVWVSPCRSYSLWAFRFRHQLAESLEVRFWHQLNAHRSGHLCCPTILPPVWDRLASMSEAKIPSRFVPLTRVALCPAATHRPPATDSETKQLNVGICSGASVDMVNEGERAVLGRRLAG